MSKKISEAQKAASARYRQKNKEMLREKGPQRMARCRAQVTENAEELERYRERARAADARYRERHRGRLASKQVDRRAMAYVKKHGFALWLEREGREETAAHLELAPESDPNPNPVPAATFDQQFDNLPGSTHDEKWNYWLDHCDPTTAPDYIPKPGEEPYLQRGKRRWF
ncbi:hypothetical protein B0H12DRAFT_1243931 [Mycena haematopus]|nr:hypothetical protein B0H12DRAFT_1243931 [Mycena haematopus]